MPLHNRIDKRILKDRLKVIPYQRKTLSFYKYHHIENPAAFRDELYLSLDKLNVWGRIYIAHEGINAQLSVPVEFFNDLKQYLYQISFLDGVRLNVAIEDDGKSFFKLKILVRNKIVADSFGSSYPQGQSLLVVPSPTHREPYSKIG